LRAVGTLTDEVRALIRAEKRAILAELAANEPAYFRWQVRKPQGWQEVRFAPSATRADVALAYPGMEAKPLPDETDSVLRNRANTGEQPGDSHRADAPADMRPCIDCANLSPGGRCLAAWRGESFGPGMAVARTWAPWITCRPQRCLPYRPGPNDRDKRTGRERWPLMLSAQVPAKTELAKGFR
jgi:hypothetical protein